MVEMCHLVKLFSYLAQKDVRKIGCKRVSFDGMVRFWIKIVR